jgi:undecaprenyl-phosphate galactose phosphotransferase
MSFDSICPSQATDSGTLDRALYWQYAIKAAADVVIAVILLAVLSPVMLLIGVCCRLDGGPAFFVQKRLGKGGETFDCLKFRSMVMDGETVLREAFARDTELQKEWVHTQKLRNDPRVTRVGRFLRKTSLDELPQLLNVVFLDMSMVGPRPIVQSEVPRYGARIGLYYSVRPGITGLWQISGRSNTSYNRRVELDVEYITGWSIWRDIAIILKTLPALLVREGAY